MPVGFVFFDAASTLLTPHPGIGYHYEKVARRHGIDVSGGDLEAQFVPAWTRAREARRGQSGPAYGRTLDEAFAFWMDVVRDCFSLAGLEPPESREFYRDLFETFAHANAWRLYDDVEPTLGLLESRGIPFGVLSNWDPRLRPVLEEFGLLPRLAALVISSEAGCEKPQREIFEIARERTGGFAPAEIALIGDSLEKDALGAMAAGWQHCLVCRKAPLETLPDDVQGSAGLLEAVKKLVLSQN